MNSRYLNTLDLSNNDLKSSDLKDLIQLLTTYKFSPEWPSQISILNVSDNIISDFSSVSTLPDGISDVRGLGQKSDPEVDQNLVKIPIDSNGRAVIPMDSIRSLVPEDFFSPLRAWMSVDANSDDPTAHKSYVYIPDAGGFQSGYFEEPPVLALDYSASGWAGIPYNRYAIDNKKRLVELEAKRNDPTYIKSLEDRGWTVDL